jgi:hypothetical protein
MPTTDFETQAGAVRDRVESGLEMLGEYGRPLLDRYGRTAAIVGVAVVAALGVAFIAARRRSRRTLAERIYRAIPEVGSRLEGPISSMRSAAGRISR